MFPWFFNNAVRNAFFHSDYVLHGDEFRSGEGLFRDENGTQSHSMKLDRIVDLMNRSMAFYTGFFNTYTQHRHSYTEDRQIEGRFGAMGDAVPVLLMADPQRGLYGFRSVPAQADL